MIPLCKNSQGVKKWMTIIWNCFYACRLFENEKLIVRALTSFHFDVLLKSFDILSQCLVLSITRKVISLLVGSGITTTYSISNTKFLLKYSSILKPIETFLIRNYFYSNAKKCK